MARPAAAGMAFRLWGARSAFSAALRGPPAPPRASHARRSSGNTSSSQGQPGGGGGAPKPSPGSSSFKLPGHKPSDWDKRFLLWTGRFKKAEDIPETVSIEMIDAARNKMRVKISYLMIVLTVVGCVGMVIAGKRAVGRHESLTSQNMEKKVRWREEAQQATAKP